MPMFHPEGPTFFELARQALSSTEQGYDLLAPKFDLTPFRTPAVFLAAAAPYLGAPGSLASALDLCCGTGAVMETLRPLCRERLVGVDFSRGMLDEARRRLGSGTGRPAIELVRGDVLELELAAQFDVVACFGSLGHFRRHHQPRLLSRVARALEPGGRFVCESAYLPRPWSWRLWLALGFNAAMAVRNTLWRPPFFMYYLSFLLPRARRLLESQGFEVETHSGFCAEAPAYHLVVATKKPTGPRRASGIRRSLPPRASPPG